MATKNDPGAFDCFSKAEPDEPMFVLLGRDPTAWAAVLLWIELRIDSGENKIDDEQIVEARQCVEAMGRWAQGKGKGLERARTPLNAALGRISGLKEYERGRREERERIVRYFRNSAGTPHASGIDAIICAAIKGLADFIERGGHHEAAP